MASISNSSIPTRTTNVPVSHTVTVGRNNQFKFDPQTLNANINDTIHWEFFPTNHSLIRGTFDNPCIPYESLVPDNDGAMWSGWETVETVGPADEMPWFNYTVTSNETLFLYCGAPGSCNGHGMVMIVNPNSTDEFSQYQKNALNAPYIIVPGESLPQEGSGGTSLSSGSSTMTPTATSSSMVSSTTTSIVTAVNTNHPSNISTGAIAGIALCGLTLILLIGILILLLNRRKHAIRRARDLDHARLAEMLQNNAQNTAQSGNPYFLPQSPIAAPAQPPAPVRETIIIPMTEAEKVQYLSRLSDMSNPTSPVLGRRDTHDRQDHRGDRNDPPYEM